MTVNIRNIGIPLLCLAIGGVFGYFVRDGDPEKDHNRTFFTVTEGGYRFINPLLACDTQSEEVGNRALRPFKEGVEQHLAAQVAAHGREVVSVYFRELNDGLWFSIGGDERFTPASMRKVPMMIAILKQSERTPGLLSRKVPARLTQDYNAYQNFKPAQTLQPERAYTVADLISRMIVFSDNNAFMLLSGIVDPRELQKVYELLSLPNPSHPDANNPFCVHTYAAFFRILFNATYLTRDLSDLALEFLTRVEFRSGIVAGVPEGIAVAHKFGEHADATSGEKQLHDCGIVFYPRHPYLLCFMSKGTSFEYLDDTIATISQHIFTEVDTQYRNEH